MKKLTKGKQYLTFFIALLMINILSFTPAVIHAADDFAELEKKVMEMGDDTAKVNLLLKLGEHFCSFDNDKALMYLQEAYTISLAKDYTEGIGKSLMWQGRVYYYKSNFSLAGKYLGKAKKPLEKTGDAEALSFWYMAKAFNLRTTGDYVHAIEMFTKSIELSKQTGNKKRMSTCYLEIGVTLLDRGDVDKAMEYFHEALAISKETDNKVGIANALTSIASAYKSKGSLDTSLAYYRQALKIRSELKMDRHIASSEIAIGETLIEMGRYAEAEQSLKHALSIFKKLDEKTGIVLTNMTLADAMNRQGKPEGVELAGRTLQMAKEIDNPNLLSYVYSKLSTIYAFNHDYQKAFVYQNKYELIKDSLFTSEKERMLAEVEAKFQSEKKDRDIALLKEKTIVERNRNIMLIVLLVVFLFVIFLLIVMFRYKSTAFKRQQQLLEQEKIIHSQENEIAKKEKQLLQEQLESKNRELASKALEMIRMNETISEIIEKLEGFNSSANTNPEMVKSIKEIIHDLETHTKQNIWNEFDKIFKNIHSEFYARLFEICPDLTSTEIKTAALLKLNLTTKEIAAIAFRSEGGIKTTRYRLRKKLGLSGDDKLVPFLMQI
ncbi:MAG: tetratricopeptide repeat protein [Chlorobi bacterium]|nr:tetratricopeptide repeat protein [Chlorobiota bacterium]